MNSRHSNIFVLIDTRTSLQIETYINSVWNGQVLYNSPHNRSRGITIFIKDTFKVEQIIHNIVIPGNLSFVYFKVKNHTFTLAAIYGPSDSDNANFFTDHVFNEENFPDSNHIIFCGDWNTVIDQKKDTLNYKTLCNPRSSKVVNQNCADLLLVDIFREKNPISNKFSWKRNNQNTRSRLDFFLISENLTPFVTNASISDKTGFKTDHFPVTITLNLQKIKSGTGFWKFSNALLQDTNWIRRTEKVIKDTILEYAKVLPDNIENLKFHEYQYIESYLNPHTFFDIILMKIRSNTIAYTAFLKKFEKLEYNRISNNISTLSNLMNTHADPPPWMNEQYELYCSQLELLHAHKTKTLLQKSRIKYSMEGEQPTKFFANIAKKCSPKVCMTKIYKVRKGVTPVLLEDQDEIQKEFTHFYQQLYKERETYSTHNDIYKFVPKDKIKVIPDEIRAASETDISETEVAKYLKNTRNNVSPGSTGFTGNFYKFYWSKLKHIIMKAIHYSFKIGELCLVQRYGIISVIPKDKKDQLYLSNWRPLTLLNTFYKLISGVLTEKIKPALEYIIEANQKAYLKDRYIGEVTRTTYDLFAYAKQRNLPGMILLIDFEKAFDSVSHEFIISTFEIHGFGPNIIKWLKIILSNFNVATNLHGNISECFTLGRGCRQGDPISGYIFILCIEILLLQLKNNINIHPYKTRAGNAHLVEGYADDLTLFLLYTTNYEENLNNLFQVVTTLSAFSDISGLQVNIGKTKLSSFGKNLNLSTLAKEAGIQWCTSFTLLGIKFDCTLSKMDDNYDDALESIKKVLDSWQTRFLTIYGKIVVIKTFVFPKFNHIITIIPNLSDHRIVEYEKLITKFLSKKGRSVLDKDIIYTPRDEGGLGLQKIRIFWNAIKLSWFRRLLTTTSFWGKLLAENFNNINPNHILYHGPNYYTEKIKLSENPFWIANIKTYNTALKRFREKRPDTRIYESLSNNDFLYPRGKDPVEIPKPKHLIIHPEGQEPIEIDRPSKLVNHILLKDILIENKTFLDLFHVNRITPIIPFSYNRLKGLVQPFVDKLNELAPTQLKLKPSNSFPTNILLLKLQKKGCKSFYELLCTPGISNIIWQKYYNYWTDVLNTPLEINDWNNLILNNVKGRYNNNLREMQILIFRNNSYSNERISKFNPTVSEKCKYCNETETIIHKLYFCEQAQKLWKLLETIMISSTIDVKITKVNAILGFITLEENSVRNILAKLTKKFIFKCSYDDVQYNSVKFIAYIRTYVVNLVLASEEYKVFDLHNWKKIYKFMIHFSHTERAI